MAAYGLHQLLAPHKAESNESIALQRQKKYLLQAFAGHIILYCN